MLPKTLDPPVLMISVVIGMLGLGSGTVSRTLDAGTLIPTVHGP